MLPGQKLQQPILRVVRVLVLIDKDVPERVLPLLPSLREAFEDVDREHQHVVEVDGVRGEQAALVERVGVRDGLVVERLHAVPILVRTDELVLRVRDLGVDPARRESFRIALELLQALLHESDLIRLVVDGEVRPVAEPLRLAAEDAPACGMEGEHPQAARIGAEQVLEPLLHLPRRFVRERDREDLVRLRAHRVNQVCDAVGEHSRLARARTGDHEQRPFRREDGLALRGIEVREVLLRRCDGHAADAIGVPPGR